MAAGGENNGVPFLLLELPPEIAAQMGANVVIEPLSEDIILPLTFSIYSGSETVHKIDPRCLPDDVADSPVVVVSMKDVDMATMHITMSHTAEEIYNTILSGKILFTFLEGTLFTTNGEILEDKEGLAKIGFAAILDPTLVFYVDRNGLLILPE